MANVVFYGILSVIPLIIGALIGTYFHVKEKVIGAIAALGAGALIAAVTFGLMEESFSLGGLSNSVIGLIIGGIIFVLGDLAIIKLGGRGHKHSYQEDRDRTGWGIVLGAVLDGIPESIALGLSLLTNKTLGLLVVVAIFLANLPEALSSAFDLKRINKSTKEIILSWFFVALVGFVFVMLGYTAFSGLDQHITSIIESVAAGAVLAMLASTMMPEAYKESGIWASVLTVVGFLVIFVLSKAGV